MKQPKEFKVNRDGKIQKRNEINFCGLPVVRSCFVCEGRETKQQQHQPPTL
jgi:hypothetical protein